MYWYMMLLTPAVMLPVVSATNTVAATLIAGAADAVETFGATTTVVQAPTQTPAQATTQAPTQTNTELDAPAANSITTDAACEIEVDAEVDPEPETQPEPAPTPAPAPALPQELLEHELSLEDPLMAAALEALTTARHEALGRMPVSSDTVLRIIGGLRARNGGCAFELETPLAIVDAVLHALARPRFDVAAAYVYLRHNWLLCYKMKATIRKARQAIEEHDQRRIASRARQLELDDMREQRKRLAERQQMRREDYARRLEMVQNAPARKPYGIRNK